MCGIPVLKLCDSVTVFKMAAGRVLFVLVSMSICFAQVHSAKILLYPGIGISHILGMTRIGQELARRNHSVGLYI